MEWIKAEKKLIKTKTHVVVYRDNNNKKERKLKKKVKSGNESRDNNDEYDAKIKLICELISLLV